MVNFTVGKEIELTDGRIVTVTSDNELASGGQGNLYYASCAGEDVILKWYHCPSALKNPEYLKPLLMDISALDIPTLILPRGVTNSLNRQYGYIMDKVPDSMHTLDSVFNDHQGKFTFKGRAVRYKVAKSIADTIAKVHNAGFSFNDINGSNIFVSREGEVKFCDVDSMSRIGDTPLVTGVREYQAPEVIKGSLPDADSDNYSLAIILFNLLVGKDPFLGLGTLGYQNDDSFNKIYGEPVFIFHPDDDTNRIEDSATKDKWNNLSPKVKESFIRTFVLGPYDKAQRVTPEEWIVALSDVSTGSSTLDTPTHKDPKYLQVYFIVDCSSGMDKYGKKSRVVKEINEYIAALKNQPDLIVYLNVLQFGEEAFWLFDEDTDVNQIKGDISLNYSAQFGGIRHAYNSLWQHLNKDELKSKSKRLHPPLLILISDGRFLGYSEDLKRLKAKPLFQESLKVAIGIDGDDRVYESGNYGDSLNNPEKVSLKALIDFAGRENTKTTGEAQKSVGQMLKEITLTLTRTLTNSGKKKAQEELWR